MQREWEEVTMIVAGSHWKVKSDRVLTAKRLQIRSLDGLCTLNTSETPETSAWAWYYYCFFLPPGVS